MTSDDILQELTDDIAFHLRVQGSILKNLWYGNTELNLYDEAADEIERLRAELIEAQDTIEGCELVIDNQKAIIDRNAWGDGRTSNGGLDGADEDKTMIEQEDTNLKMVTADRDRWKRTAEVLARELGKAEYAFAEYDNQEDERYPSNLETITGLRAEITHLHTLLEQEKFLVRGIVEAITNKGSHPSYHDRILNKQRRLHPTLWNHLDKLVESVCGTTVTNRAKWERNNND